MANFYEDPNDIKRTANATLFEGTKSYFSLQSGLLMLSLILIILSIIGDVIATFIVGAKVSPTYFWLFTLEIPLIVSAVITWKLYKYASWAIEEHKDLEERLELIEERLKHIK